MTNMYIDTNESRQRKNGSFSNKIVSLLGPEVLAGVVAMSEASDGREIYESLCEADKLSA